MKRQRLVLLTGKICINKSILNEIERPTERAFSLFITFRNKLSTSNGDDTTSRDSDSLIQEYATVPPTDLYKHCWNHPKIRENWRTVLAAVMLLVIGVILVGMGIYSIAKPANGSQGFVFLLAGKFNERIDHFKNV